MVIHWAATRFSLKDTGKNRTISATWMSLGVVGFLSGIYKRPAFALLLHSVTWSGVQLRQHYGLTSSVSYLIQIVAQTWEVSSCNINLLC